MAGVRSLPSQWESSDGQTCAHGVSDGFIRFRRRAVDVAPGLHLGQVVVFKAQRPNKVLVKGWEEVDEDGRPSGGS